MSGTGRFGCSKIAQPVDFMQRAECEVQVLLGRCHAMVAYMHVCLHGVAIGAMAVDRDR